jgi:hypothetical protein
MGYVSGAALVILRVLIILFGDMKVGKPGGVVTRAFSMPPLNAMLSPKGNPSMDNLAAIFGAIGSRLKVGLKVHTVRAA